MAHFAKIENGIVTQVCVVTNNDCGGGDFPDSEPIGQAYLASLGFDGEWKQTSYHGNFRKVFAGIGWAYNYERDCFVEPQNYSSWILNEETSRWEPPVPYPSDGETYDWDDANQEWVLLD